MTRQGLDAQSPPWKNIGYNFPPLHIIINKKITFYLEHAKDKVLISHYSQEKSKKKRKKERKEGNLEFAKKYLLPK